MSCPSLFLMIWTPTCVTCFSSSFPPPWDLHLTCSCGLSPLFTKAHSSPPHSLPLSEASGATLSPSRQHQRSSSPFPTYVLAPSSYAIYSASRSKDFLAELRSSSCISSDNVAETVNLSIISLLLSICSLRCQSLCLDRSNIASPAPTFILQDTFSVLSPLGTLESVPSDIHHHYL